MTQISYKAQELACKYHKGQMYGSMPYTQHLFEVEEECRRLFYGGYRHQDQFDVCWLHDILEDTRCTADILMESKFSEEAITCILLLTKTADMNRKDYLYSLAHCKDASPLAWQVKVADAMCNLRHSIIALDSRRINRYIETLNVLYGGNT